MSGTVVLSWGRYGGFYTHRYRICLGWVAFTWMPLDFDDILRHYNETIERADSQPKEPT